MKCVTAFFSYPQLLVIPNIIIFFLTSLSFFMDLSADSNSPFHIQVFAGATRKKIPRAPGVLPP